MLRLNDQSVWSYSLFTEQDVVEFQAGTHARLYEKFGNHVLHIDNTDGTYFSVWAPNATAVSVVGDFNHWDSQKHHLFPRWDKSGIWEGFIPHLTTGELYKYHIWGYESSEQLKGDPFATYWEKRPNTASITWDLKYRWSDKRWMRQRKKRNSLDAPWSVYEMHLASWQRPDPNDEGSYNSYEVIAAQLVPYLTEMGFTHVEFMPVMEYPFDGSWGYQCTGYFAPSSRFGLPEGLMFLIDQLHQANIGVILDWVPSHFPNDAHGLFLFDGAHTYEYADMRKGFHPDWNSYIFNYARGEVRSFLISNAHFWFNYYHIDGIRVDAVSSMLKLNYSRADGEWEPNQFGGNGNIEAIAFLKLLNEVIYRDFPSVQTIAEEATDWPGISRPTFQSGIGFGMKWMMGWMHDTLRYFKSDPLYRQHVQDKFSFSMMYFYDENFMLPLSHDEVVHGKSPLIYKMPGDEWQKFANLRLLYTYMWTHPGAKLLFMGGEFGQTSEWDFRTELQWPLLQHPIHSGLRSCVAALNQLLTTIPALFERQFYSDGFRWLDLSHRQESVIAYQRMDKKGKAVIVLLNMTPIARNNWTLNLVGKLKWKVLFCSDLKSWGGSSSIEDLSVASSWNDRKQKQVNITLHLPPLAGVVLG
jgi:1,4-alpha-glucan branching enzyme